MDLLVLHVALGGMVLISLGIAVKLLSDPSWLSGFFKGIFGLLFLVIAASFGYMIVDMSSFRAVDDQTPIALLKVSKKGQQRYDIQVAVNGQVETYDLFGDRAFLNVRMIYWSGPAIDAGLKTAYRLANLSGQFSSEKQKRNIKKSFHELHPKPFIDLWYIIQQLGGVPMIEARFAKPLLIPLKDQPANFKIFLGERGLRLKPAGHQ